MNSTDLFVGLMLLLFMFSLAESLVFGAEKRCGINGVSVREAPLGARLAFLVLGILLIITLWSFLSSFGILERVLSEERFFLFFLLSFFGLVLYISAFALTIVLSKQIALKLEDFFWGAITPFAPDSEPA